MGLFDIGHVAKLHEIQAARLSAGQEGIGSEVESLIRQLEMGGVNQWRIQAKRLWDSGFGRLGQRQELPSLPRWDSQDPERAHRG